MSTGLVLPAYPPLLRPAAALPAGRVGYDVSADLLLCHTFVPRPAYDELRARGELVARPELTSTEWPAAYAWMWAQLSLRCHAGAPVPPPLWVWARTTRAELIDQARFHAAKPGPATVLLTCRLPREQVLLSDYLEWHIPLNDAPVLTLADGADPHDPASYDEAGRAWDARMDELAPGHRDLPSDQWPPVVREHLEATWVGVLGAEGRPRRIPLQGVVARISAAQVVAAVQLLGPRRRAPQTD